MKHQIMMVDDSRVMYAAMKKMLEGTDVEIVQYCRSGEEALESYSSSKAELVLMDIVMPGMDGFETARRILEQWPDAHILMLSSLAYDETVETAASIGTKGFLFKPFEKETLLGRIHEILSESAQGITTGGILS